MNILQNIKRNWFNTAALFLGVILVVNLFSGFTKLHLLWKNKTDKSLVTDVAKWQTWLNQNSELFASLTEGAKFGITKNLDSDYGI